MKRTAFTSFLMAILILASCNKPEPTPKPTPTPTPKPTPTPTEAVVIDSGVDVKPTIAASGGETKVSFKATEDWTASIINTKADSWISLDKTSGSAGNATVTIKVTANDTSDDRNATVQIKAGKTTVDVVVTQKGKDALTTTPSKTEFGAEGGDLKIDVKANIDFTYSVAEDCKDWIVEASTKAMTTKTLSFVVAPNEDAAKREGSVTIKSSLGEEVINVYQSGAAPTIILTQNEYVVKAEGETIQVEVKSNVDVDVEIPSECTWISEKATKAMSTNTFYFTVAANVSYDARTAVLIFTNKANGLSEKISVSQMQKDAILLAKSEYEVDLAGETLSFVAQTNVALTITLADDAQGWIQPVGTKAMTNVNISLNVLPAEKGVDRTGKITISGGSVSQNITIRQHALDSNISIPDANFKAFLVKHYDKNGDGEISKKEAQEIKKIKLYSENIESLFGIEEMVNLEELICSFNDGLTSLDVSRCCSLLRLDCSVNNIKNLDISGCSLLREINCQCNSLENLDVSNNLQLEKLRCGENPISSLDLSHNVALKEFDCYNTNLESLDISNNPSLITFHLTYSPLKSIDFSSNPALEEINVYVVSQETLDVSCCPSLLVLRCRGDNLSHINVNGCSKLVNLDCSLGQLTELNLSGCSALQYADCRSNQLTSLNVDGCGSLKTLFCQDNQLATLDLSTCVALEMANCSENHLTRLNVDNCGELQSLDCLLNNLSELNVGDCVKLWNLQCQMNQLVSLDVRKNPLLSTLICYDNRITTLDLKNNTKINNLNCGSNQLSSLDVSNIISLQFGSCVGNPNLTELWLRVGQTIYPLYFSYDDKITTIKYRGVDDVK